MMVMVKISCHLEVYVILETYVNECLVQTKNSTDFFNFVPFSEVEKGNVP